MFGVKSSRLFSVAALTLLCANIGFSQEPGQPVLRVAPPPVSVVRPLVLQLPSTSIRPQAPSGPPSATVDAYGVPVSPSMYLVNFLLLYFSSPDVAANMPAYRAALPPEVYNCLLENPEGCPYVDMERYFVAQAGQVGGSRNKISFWPGSCQADPRWQRLAPPEYRTPDQLNEPLGRKNADRLARLLGITQEMILTPAQYDCQIGSSPRDPAREIVFECTETVTNSNGNATPALSSYGLSLDDQGNVRSDCAPDAPCLEFNQLVFGPLEEIARECDFGDKLKLLFTETPLVELANQGAQCQSDWLPACIVQTARAGTVKR